MFHQLGKLLRLSLRDLPAEVALLHPAHREQVDEGAEDAVPEAVLARPLQAWAVADGDLHDRSAFDLYERRQEAVDAGVELDRRERRSAERLERAAGVDDVVARETVADSVRDLRRETADRIVAAGSAVADRRIVAVERGEELRDVVRVVLHVGVDRDDDVAARVLEAGVEGGRLPAVRLEV